VIKSSVTLKIVTATPTIHGIAIPKAGLIAFIRASEPSVRLVVPGGDFLLVQVAVALALVGNHHVRHFVSGAVVQAGLESEVIL